MEKEKAKKKAREREKERSKFVSGRRQTLDRLIEINREKPEKQECRPESDRRSEKERRRATTKNGARGR